MEKSCDVAVIGGAFSGAATGLLLKRKLPGSSVIIIEKSTVFDRKVGESTTEVSSCFLTRVLGVSTYLGHEHLAKQGLRMWFSNSADQPFEDCVELGGRYNSRLSGFQVDRAKLDEHLLALAVEAGCELMRPAKVTEIECGGIGRNRLKVSIGGETQEIRAKWVVDASGRAAVLARSMNLLKPLEEHPVHSIWGRFTGVKDWDGYELRKKFPRYASAARTGRSWATNHLMGLGWWCWIIPLRGGDTSIGLVYDSRLYTPPDGASIAARLRAHFLSHPVGREILADAQPVENDQRAYSPLSYLSGKVSGDGWVMAGDAGSFMDPFYSPGLDFCAFTAHAAHTVIARSLEGGAVSAADLEKYNDRFQFCFRSWFDAIYRDKYFYMGDAELMAAAFLLDIAMYHLGPVRQVYANPDENFSSFPFGGVPGRIVARLMAFYNGRLSALARRKIAAGRYGDRNSDWRLMIGGFAPDASLLKLALRGLFYWWRAELGSMVSRGRKTTRRPDAETVCD